MDLIKCASFTVTKPLTEMQSIDDFYDDVKKSEEKKEITIRRKVPAGNPTAKAIAPAVDPIAQTSMGTKSMVPPIANWQAQSGSGYPPDPSGAAGPNHYVQAVNTAYKIYTKTGGAVTGGGPFNLSSLWSGSTNDGDPIVMYDRFADRWFISQFNGNDKILVAISTTNNPTGS